MEIQLYEVIPQHILDGIQVVHQSVFNGDLLKEHKLQRKNLIAFVAIVDDVVAGFKLGYEKEPSVFYSWLGGVHPNYQKRGIASKLMEAQHEEIRARGYQKVRTYSRNVKKEMLILNLKFGFDVISTFVDEKNRHKIVLEKML